MRNEIALGRKVDGISRSRQIENERKAKAKRVEMKSIQPKTEKAKRIRSTKGKRASTKTENANKVSIDQFLPWKKNLKQ